MSQCKATSKQTGQQCKRLAMKGKEVCDRHGGKSLTGIASPALRTGRHSKYLPQRMMEAYQTARQDGELLDLSEEIALMDARLSDLMSRVDSGESGHLWTKARQAFKDFEAARIAKDSGAMGEALTALQQALNRGVSDYAVWEQIQGLMEQRRKLVETERKRRIDMHTMMRDDEAMLLVHYLLTSVTTHVKDRATLAAIQNDLTAVLGTRVPQGAANLSAGSD
jgi:hypothetical protein